MVLKEESSTEEESRVPCSGGSRKLFWRSASWSSSRTALNNPEASDDSNSSKQHCADSTVGKTPCPRPLTPRSQNNCKARSFLPPLQPLTVRRSFDEWPKAGSDDIGEWLQPATPGGRGNGERLKLDLSAIQHNPDKNNGGLGKRDKIAFFDKTCSKVANHIYLGGDAVAKDRDILRQNGITHILNCVGFVCPEYFKADFVYRTLWLQDSPSEDITSILYDVFDYFEDVREQGGRVFVHCCQGVSRSTSLVIAYLMWREGHSFDDAFQIVKAARGIADPNMGFACQLLQCQKRVHAIPLSPSSLLRIYRMAPHSPYDPLHLVLKMLSDPSPSALDSRGAFIIHVPCAIYVWIGKNCDPMMERDARGAVCQIVRYERVQGSITMIKEGEEPTYFWDAFSNLLPLMDKSSTGKKVGDSLIKIRTGERIVNSYSVDFEIFQKAVKGGFVPPFALSGNEHETRLPARESSWSALRRKFAHGNMKEFVSAIELSVSRIVPDSLFVPGADNFGIKPSHSENLSASSSPQSCSSSSLSSSSSSSASPPYLSPDSLSSDSNGSLRCLSESPLESPRVSSSPRVPSNLSVFSNLSLVSSQAYQSANKSPGSLNPNYSSQPHSQPVFTSPKKLSLSLAERRGSMSKSLKLPLGLDDKTSSKDSIGKDQSPCSSLGSHDIEIVFKPRDSLENELRDSLQHYEVKMIDEVESSRNYPLGASQESGTLSGIRESDADFHHVKEALVWRWPSLERIASFSRGDLQSKAAFVISTPNRGKQEDRFLYFWIGKSFSADKKWMRESKSNEVRGIDWSRVSSDIIFRIGLSKDTCIKIIAEDEEPAEFLDFLKP